MGQNCEIHMKPGKYGFGLASVLRWGTYLEMIMFKFWTQLGYKIPLSLNIWNDITLLIFSSLVLYVHELFISHYYSEI